MYILKIKFLLVLSFISFISNVSISTAQANSYLVVHNAGMVILSSYYRAYFERLGLIGSDGNFISKIEQMKAVNYLQYLVTESENTEENLLLLNKILTGIPLKSPISQNFPITEEEKQLANSLIKSAISHWPAAGATEISGFRGNWLLRDGFLVETDTYWELTVDRRAYDILLNSSPFSFSIIKYPWMTKPLRVTWPH